MTTVRPVAVGVPAKSWPAADSCTGPVPSGGFGSVGAVSTHANGRLWQHLRNT